MMGNTRAAVSRGKWVWLGVFLLLQACGGGGGDDPPPQQQAPPPPSALSYASPQTFAVGTAITPLSPTVTGSVTSYAVAPVLPAGLTLDSATGAIAGTPTAPAATADYTVTASNAGGSTTFALSIRALLERGTADRADDKTGPQVHVLYVLPSDGVDREIDTLGQIEGSVKAWNKWFVTQTGKEIRVDTYGGGTLDVTFLRLPRTDAEMNAAGGNVRDKLEFHLLANSFDAVDKVYLVYYGGAGDGCGRGAWPPVRHGNVAAMYVGSPNCTPLALAGENDPPAFWDFLAPHEILHVLGFAPSCAAHHSENGHVTDSPLDLLYSGGGQPWAPSTLDVNHDDYFGNTNAACPAEIGNSAFLEPPAAGAALPPGWPYVNHDGAAAKQECANESTVTPGPAGADTQITFVNAYAPNDTPTTIVISEVVVSGAGVRVRQQRATIQHLAGSIVTPGVLPVKENAVFVATEGTAQGTCLGLVRATAAPSRFVVRP